MNSNDKRLIEVAFPLKQASLDSMHEKNVRHGHISTLHIWPARRPLAASRAALIATLLPDPGNKDERNQLLERLGGKIIEVVKKKKLPSGKIEEKVVPETVGGVLHWGQGIQPRSRMVPPQKSRTRTTVEPHEFWTHLRAGARSHWRRCGLDAKSLPTTSIRSHGSF